MNDIEYTDSVSKKDGKMPAEDRSTYKHFIEWLQQNRTKNTQPVRYDCEKITWILKMRSCSSVSSLLVNKILIIIIGYLQLRQQNGHALG